MSTTVKSADERLLGREVGRAECLLGNEAIVRGAIEAGVAFMSGYPGTPSSEVTDTFARLSAAIGVTFEYSVNEKIAIEVAYAAALAGARSLCAMKHLGLMYAGDPLSTIPYVGVEAGMVILSAGDPSCRTSPNEQDQRHLGPMLHLPVLDPTTPAAALSMTRAAFELSERSRLPVLLRATTRVCHSRAPVTYGPIIPRRVSGFVRSPGRYVPVPHNARRMRLEIGDRLAVAEAFIEAQGWFDREGRGDLAVLACGAPAATTSDLLEAHGLLHRDGDGSRVALWSLGAIYPLPTASLIAGLRSVKRVLVVEELSPFVEDRVRALCSEHRLDVEVLGKRSGHFPEAFEYEPRVIEEGLVRAGLLSASQTFSVPARALQPPLPPVAAAEEPRTSTPPCHDLEVPARPPSLCPGCPHRAAFIAAKAAFGVEQLYFNDVGCYTLGYGPPLDAADALLSMGAGFTLASGVARVTGQRTVGFMGDGTFFHSGMPALLNAIKEGVSMVAVILDNRITAMTGFQESPSATPFGDISIAAVVRALGAGHVEVVDPYNIPQATAAFERARDETAISVVIVERACPVYQARRRDRGGPRLPIHGASESPIANATKGDGADAVEATMPKTPSPSAGPS